MKVSASATGLLYSIMAYALFSAYDVTIKTISEKFSAFQLASTTYAFVALLLAAKFLFSSAEKRREHMAFHAPVLHAVRGAVHAVALSGMFLGLTHLPLAEMYVIGFLTPLLVPFFAAFFLKEKISLRLLAALGVSFAGVLVAVHPQAHVDLYALLCFGGFVFYAFSILLMRKMTQTESTFSIMLSMNVMVGVFLTLAALPHYVMPSLGDMLHFMLAAVFNFIGYTLLVTAARLAPAALISAPQFLQLVYGALAGLVFFKDVPSRDVLLGGGIVIIANMFLIYAQRKKEAPRPLS